MLILNGYKSHNSLKFLDLYKKKGIVTLYILAHALYLLQLLDIGCFSPLKKAYGNKVGCLIRNRIYSINKLSFLLQSLVKGVRAKATQKMTFPAKLLCNNHAIDSRTLKNIGSSSQIYV